MAENSQAMLFDISRYMIEDGPGIRTDIFFKGCPLRCLWCSNPFGLSRQPHLAFNKRRCVRCLGCMDVCPNKAVSVNGDEVITDFRVCDACGLCVAVCPNKARVIVGKLYTVHEMMEIIERDRMFYRRCSGGVTLTGGEVLLQHSVVREILTHCRRQIIHTAIETSGYGEWKTLQEIMSLCDLVFIDIKHANPDAHLRLTGVKNNVILNNIREAAELCHTRGAPTLILRMPVVPGVNDDMENIGQTGAFVASLPGRTELNLLPYHRLGSNKYEMIGLEYQAGKIEPPSKEHMVRLQEIIMRHNVRCTAGGSEISDNK